MDFGLNTGQHGRSEDSRNTFLQLYDQPVMPWLGADKTSNIHESRWLLLCVETVCFAYLLRQP